MTFLLAGAAESRAASTPFGGTAAPVPGTVPAANFDNGGEGVAYHDTTSGNAGGAYRQGDVDIEASSEGGFDVGWTAAGEWLSYTVAIARAGTYVVTFRVAALGAGGAFHLEVAGANVTGSIAVPDTGSKQSYQNVARTVTLPAGSQVMRLVMESVGARGFVGNFLSMQFAASSTSTPYSGTAAVLPGTVRAENFDQGGEGVAYHDTTSGNAGGAYRQTDVDIEASSSAGGFDLGWIVPGEWLNYTVDVRTAGAYTVAFRVASAASGGSFHLEMGGARAADVAVPNTGGWQTFQTVTRTVTLQAGVQIARLVMDTGGGSKNVIGNIASMQFGLASGGGPASTAFSGTPVALPGTVEAENFDNGGEGVAYHDTTPGNAGGAYRTGDVDIEPASSGGYSIGWAVAGEWLNYSVTVGTAGSYTVAFRVASSGAGGSFHLEMNGINVTGAVSVPDTGGWQSWQTVSRTVTLAAGPQIARLVMDSNAAKAVGNFDAVVFSAGSAPPPPDPPAGGGATIQVAAGGDLQGAIDAAQPGDTILLAAGALYRGQFVLRVKPGSSYITIRSSASDATLPADGVRVLPSSAGRLATLQGGVAGMPVITTDPGAHHYRLQFLELTSTYRDNQIVQIGDFGTAQNTSGEVPHHIVIDRCYIHGDPTVGQKRGILFNAASASVINSYISDIKSTQDESQGIGISNGPGPFTITNNYIEAAGENLLFGGADPSIANLVPSDIVIANNHITKQPSWRGQFIEKNLLEFKNAQRVVVDNNLMEYCWEQGQQGFAIVLTPRNQDGGAPWSVVQHFQFTNNVIRHVASVFNILGLDDTNTTQTVTNDIVVRNNLFLDVNTTAWGGAGVLVLTQGARNLTFDHNTVFTDGTSVVFADSSPTTAFVFTNNIAPDNLWAIMGSNQSPGNGTIAAFFPGGTVARNVLIGGNSATYPANNFYPAVVGNVGFVNVNGGDYRLSSSSPYAHAATDGGAIGYSGPPVQ